MSRERKEEMRCYAESRAIESDSALVGLDR